MLTPGTKAPDFSLTDHDTVTHTLAQYQGEWVLLYFYPKDDTPGCTKEACMIAEAYDDFARLGVTVIGVSIDDPASHATFREKYHLPFTLLSDETGEMIAQYEALSEKKVLGATLRMAQRISYLIDPSGTIAKAYPDVDPATHAAELLRDIAELKEG